MSRRRAVKASLKFVVLAMLATSIAAPSRAVASEPCSHTGGVVQITLEGSWLHIVRSGDDIEITLEAGRVCPGATIDNTAEIRVDRGSEPSSRYQQITLDLSGGMFAAAGSPDIDFYIGPLGPPPVGGERIIEIVGSGGADYIDAGATGMRLNREDDVDVTYDSTNFHQLWIDSGSGDDHASAAGGAGIGGPLSIATNIVGGAGDDELLGGSADDLIDGREGYDTAHGGLGGDTCWGVEDDTSCEMPLNTQPATWVVQCQPGPTGARCVGGGSSYPDDGMGGGIQMFSSLPYPLPGNGTGTAVGRSEQWFDLNEPATSVSISTHHEIGWAHATLNQATLGSASATLTVTAFALECQPTCVARATQTIVDSTTGPASRQNEDMGFNLELTNGGEPLPRTTIYVYVTISLRATLGEAVVPSGGAPYATVTSGANRVSVRPNP